MAEFMLESTKHSYILNMLALGLMVSEKKIFEGSLYKYMNPWDVATLGPRVLIGRIYVGDH